MADRRLVGNFALLSIAEIAAKSVNVVAFTYLGRLLGPQRYGDLEFALSAILLLTLFVDFGVGAYAAREAAREPEGADALTSSVIALRALAGLLCFGLAAVFAWAAPKPDETRWMAAAAATGLLLAPAHLLWRFQSVEAMGWAAGLAFVRNAGFALCALALFRPGDSLAKAGWFEAAAVGASAALGWAAWRYALGRPAPRLIPTLDDVLRRLGPATAVGLAHLAWAALWFLPLTLTGLRVHDESLGWFAAAHRAVMALHAFVWWYFFNLLPTASRGAARPPDEERAILERSLGLAAWGAGLGALAVAWLGGPVLRLAYGGAFTEAGAYLAALVWAIPLAALSGHDRTILLARRLERPLLRATTIGAAVAAAFSFFGAEAWGAWAGAAGLAAGNVVVLVLCRRLAAPIAPSLAFGRTILKPSVAVALGAAPLLLGSVAALGERAALGLGGALLLAWLWRPRDSRTAVRYTESNF